MKEHPSRRDLLWRLGGGLGGIALAQLLGQEGLLAGPERFAPGSNPELNGGLHHRARACRVIQLFMNGGVSQMDTFDHKPELAAAARPAVRPGGSCRGPHEYAGQPDEEPVPVPATWRVRPVGEQRLPPTGDLRRRHGVPDGPELEDERPRAGQLHDEHRIPDARLSQPGGLAVLWPRFARRQPAHVRGPA